MIQDQKPSSKLKDVLKEFTAGLVGGWAQVLVGQPFDTIKVRLQTQSTVNPIYKGPLDCIQTLIKQEGPLGLYKGTTSPLIGVGAAVSIQFGVSENMKKFLSRFSEKSHRLELPLIAISGVVAGGANSIVQTVVEHFRIKMQLQRAGESQYKGSIDCAKQIYNSYGLKGVFKGFVPTFLRESVGMMFYFSVYEMVTRKFYTEKQKISECPTYAILLAGALAGNIFWITTYPFDVVKSKIQGDQMDNPKYKGMMDCFKQTARGGIKSFFPGFIVCMLRASPANAVTFLAFNKTMQALNPQSNTQ